MTECSKLLSELTKGKYNIWKIWGHIPPENKPLTVTGFTIKNGERYIDYIDKSGNKKQKPINDFILEDVQGGDPNRLFSIPSKAYPEGYPIEDVINYSNSSFNQLQKICDKEKQEEEDKKPQPEPGYKKGDDDPFCKDCLDCYETYKKAIKQVVSHVQNLLTNKTVGIIGTATGDSGLAGAEEPGCLAKGAKTIDARGKTWDGKGDFTKRNPFAVQPNNADGLNGLDSAPLQENKDVYDNIIRKIDAAAADAVNFNDAPPAAVNIPALGGNLPPTKIRGKKLSRKERCNQLLIFLAGHSNQAKPDAALGDIPPDYVRAGVNRNQWQNLNTAIIAWKAWCCGQAIKAVLAPLKEQPYDLGILGNLVGDHYGGASPHAQVGTGSLILLKEGLACCSDELLCPDLKCAKNAGANDNAEKIDQLIQSLQSISEGCVRKLKNNLEGILYGPDGLHTRLLKYSIIKSFQARRPTDAIVPWWPEWSNGGNDAAGNIVRNPCQTTFIKGFITAKQEQCYPKFPDMTPPTPPAHLTEEQRAEFLADVAICFTDDCLFEQPISSVRTGYEYSGEGSACDTPIIDYIDLPDFTINGKNIQQRYEEILEQLIRLAQEAITTTITNALNELGVGTPDDALEDQKRCEEAKKTERELKQKIIDLAKEIDALTQRIKQCDLRISEAEKKLSEGVKPFPNLPPRKDGSSVECDQLRLAYNRRKSDFDVANNRLEPLLEEINLLQSDLENWKSAQASVQNAIRKINSLSPRVLTEQATPNIIQDVNISIAIRRGTALPATATFANVLAAAQTEDTSWTTEIENQERKISGKNTDINNARTEISTISADLRSIAEKIGTFCDEKAWFENPNMPTEENFDANRIKNLLVLIASEKGVKESLQNQRQDLQNTKAISEARLNETIIYKDSICSDPETGKNQSVRNCLLDCIRKGVRENLKGSLILNLDMIIKAKDCTNYARSPGEEPSNKVPGQNLGTKIFNTDATVQELRDKLKNIVLSCLNNGVPSVTNTTEVDGENVRLPRCQLLKDAIQLIEEQIKKLGPEEPVVNIINNSIAANPVVAGAGVAPTIDAVNIEAIVTTLMSGASTDIRDGRNSTILKELEDLFIRLGYKAGSENLSIVFGVAQALVSKRAQTLKYKSRLETEKQQLNDEFAKCTEPKNKDLENPNPVNTCAGILLDLRDKLRPLLLDENGPKESLFSEFFDKTVQILDDQVDDDDLSLKNLQDQIINQISAKLRAMCPGLKSKRPDLFPDADPNDLQVITHPPGHPRAGEPIVEIDIYCDQEKKIWKIGYQYRIKRPKFFGDEQDAGSPVNCFWKTITGFLNNTVLCADKNPTTRKSIFHNFWETEIEKILPKDTEAGGAQRANRRRGPRYIPEIIGAGPYFFPPPNDYQVIEAEGDFSKIDPPCPQHCGEVPEPPATAKDGTFGARYTLVRRLFFEMASVHQYLKNVADNIDLSIDALAALKEGLVYCSTGILQERDADGKTLEFIDSTKGKSSILNPANHAPRKNIAGLPTYQMPDKFNPYSRDPYDDEVKEALLKVAIATILPSNPCPECISDDGRSLEEIMEENDVLDPNTGDPGTKQPPTLPDPKEEFEQKIKQREKDVKKLDRELREKRKEFEQAPLGKRKDKLKDEIQVLEKRIKKILEDILIDKKEIELEEKISVLSKRLEELESRKLEQPPTDAPESERLAWKQKVADLYHTTNILKIEIARLQVEIDDLIAANYGHGRPEIPFGPREP